MSDSQKSDPFAAAGSGKSPEEVAFDLVNKLKGQGVWGEKNMPAILDMYAECLDATRGLRSYEGQNRVNRPIVDTPRAEPAVQTSAPPQAQPRQQTQPATLQQVAPQNPVQQQQAQIQHQMQQQIRQQS